MAAADGQELLLPRCRLRAKTAAQLCHGAAKRKALEEGHSNYVNSRIANNQAFETHLLRIATFSVSLKTTLSHQHA
jgi:hypothetical protein